MPRGHFKENRFQFLLLALLLQFALGGWFPKEHNDFIHAAAMVGWLAAAIYALRLERRHLIAVVAAGLVVVGLMFIRGAEPVEDAAAFFVLCALGAGVLRHILRAKQVTFDTVCASLSVYIVIGLVFATIYIGLVKELGVDEHGASVAFTGLSGEDHSERWARRVGVLQLRHDDDAGVGRHHTQGSFRALLCHAAGDRWADLPADIGRRTRRPAGRPGW
ncbi:MAG: hypothetical protein V3T86_11140 [Planctomycetota bacterium]